jgi:DNA invertase Pin-like site-specific DNA recombinase
MMIVDGAALGDVVCGRVRAPVRPDGAGVQRTAHFERRLIAERTKNGIAAARARGKRPGRQPLDRDRAEAALKLVAAGLPPTAAARQVGLGRSTVYRELRHTGADRLTAPVTPTFAEGSPLALSI